MMTAKFQPEPGDTVYLEDGRKGRFIAMDGANYVVQPCFKSVPRGDFDDLEDETEYGSGCMFAHRVFAEPPTEIYDARVAEMRADIEKLVARTAAARTAVATAEREHKERVAKLAKYPPLEMLEALLDKRVTHFAVKEHYSDLWDVQTFEEATTREEMDYGRKKTELRMLALVGKGDLLEWKVNHYYDGSSATWNTVIPCLSYEEALTQVSGFILEAAAKLKPEEIDSRHVRIADIANKYGIALPQWIPDAVARLKAEHARKEIERAEAALALVRAKAVA